MQAIKLLNTVESLIHGFNWHNPSWSLFIILFWLTAGVIYAFAAGRGRILTILVSVYMAKLLVIEAPFLTQALSHHINTTVASLQQLATFVILFLLLFLFLGRYAFKTSADGRQLTSFVFGIIFSVLQVGLLINIIISFLPDAVKSTFDPLIQFIFIQYPASFLWLIAPIVFLMLLGKFVSERAEL
jgi:hypothetical protein